MLFEVDRERADEVPPTIGKKKGKTTTPLKRPKGYNPFRPLTDEELDRVVFRTRTNKMGDGIGMYHKDGGTVVQWDAGPSRTFTIRDLAEAIAETEAITRAKSDWMGGPDVHHVYFEGLDHGKDGVWRVSWGS
jgi:hypothetical protein